MKLYHWIWIFVLGVFAAGCYSQSQVYSDKLKDVDLSTFDTYAWLPTAGDSMSLLNNEILQNNLMAEIDSQLQMRGYEPNGQNPDMLVLMHVRFDKETDVYQDPVYGSYDYVYPVYTVSGYPYYYRAYDRITYVDGYTIDTVKYTTGSVIIDVIDAETNKLVWRGWSERVVDRANYERTLSRDIGAIFREYPVAIQAPEYSVR